jgi:hypothetical protein
MAAATLNSFIYGYSGNRRMLSANISVANTNTLNTGFSMIDSISLDSSAQVNLGATAVGGVITFATSGADTAAWLVVYGV